MIVPGSVARTTVGEPSYYLGTRLLLKMVLLDQRLHQGFIISYLDSITSTKALCLQVAAKLSLLATDEAGDLLFGQVTDVIPPHTSL